MGLCLSHKNVGESIQLCKHHHQHHSLTSPVALTNLLASAKREQIGPLKLDTTATPTTLVIFEKYQRRRYTMTAMFPPINYLKTIVSKNRNRHKENGFDLDLTYITERIIAMAYPAERVQSMYRNHLNDVYEFLELKHKDHYYIYNLCSERSYDRAKFCNRVKIYPFEDHNPPSFVIIKSFCEDVHQWLENDPENVIAIHCKAGKGRTGTMICCYLLHCGMYERASDAIEFYGRMRTQDGHGVTIPSQIRYIKYYEQFLRDKLTYAERPIYIKRVQIKPAPKFSEPVLFTVKQRTWVVKKNLGKTNSPTQESDENSEGECAAISYEGKHYETKQGYKSENISYRSNDPEVTIEYPEIRTLTGDISIELYYRSPVLTKKKRFARIWINSFFADLNGLPLERGENRFRHLTFRKSDIDLVWKKDKRHRRLAENFVVTVHIKVPTTAEEIRAAEAALRQTELAKQAPVEAQNEDTSGAEDTSEDENDWESGGRKKETTTTTSTSPFSNPGPSSYSYVQDVSLRDSDVLNKTELSSSSDSSSSSPLVPMMSALFDKHMRRLEEMARNKQSDESLNDVCTPDSTDTDDNCSPGERALNVKQQQEQHVITFEQVSESLKNLRKVLK